MGDRSSGFGCTRHLWPLAAQGTFGLWPHRHVMSWHACHVMACHVMACHDMSCHGMRVMACHDMPVRARKMIRLDPVEPRCAAVVDAGGAFHGWAPLRPPPPPPPPPPPLPPPQLPLHLQLLVALRPHLQPLLWERLVHRWWLPPLPPTLVFAAPAPPRSRSRSPSPVSP